MPSFTTRLADGWERAQHQLPLALVPLLTAALNTDKIEKILTFRGGHFGFQLGLPTGVVDLWEFVSVPNTGVNVDLGGPVVPAPLVFVVLPVALAIQAGLAAGYFGSIRDALVTDSYEFVTNIRRYFLPFVLYTLIPVLFLLPLVLLGGAGGLRALLPLMILLLPAYLLLAYLFYATPYLVVLRETDLVSALRASYALARMGGPYLSYALGFAGFVFVSSLFATAVVVNLGLVGVILGVIIAAPVGLAANIATMRFVADIDPETPPLVSWTDQDSNPLNE